MVYHVDRSEYSSERLYAKTLAKSIPLPREQEVELSRRIKKRDKKAFDDLINANLRFVFSIAQQYQNRGLSMPELISAGNEGLVKATKRFDEERGFKFISYAVWYVRQAILQALRTEVDLVRIPDYQHDKICRLNMIAKSRGGDLEDALEFDYNGSADELDRAALAAYRVPCSLDSEFEDGKEDNLYSVLANNEEPSDHQLYENALKDEIEKVFSSCLNEREAEVLRDYFGLDERDPKTLEEIGEKIGITKEGVRYIKNRALKKLRHPPRAKYLEPYLEY